MLRRHQRPTPRLLPAGATVAGWDIFLPLDQRALFTAHAKLGLPYADPVCFPGTSWLLRPELPDGDWIVRSMIESPKVQTTIDENS